jgi:hypothetical protein
LVLIVLKLVQYLLNNLDIVGIFDLLGVLEQDDDDLHDDVLSEGLAVEHQEEGSDLVGLEDEDGFQEIVDAHLQHA